VTAADGPVRLRGLLKREDVPHHAGDLFASAASWSSCGTITELAPSLVRLLSQYPAMDWFLCMS
jgi:hypothetical protein